VNDLAKPTFVPGNATQAHGRRRRQGRTRRARRPAKKAAPPPARCPLRVRRLPRAGSADGLSLRPRWPLLSLPAAKRQRSGRQDMMHMEVAVARTLPSRHRGLSWPSASNSRAIPERYSVAHGGDSPRHQSGDRPTTTWCGASLTVLKHPHCGNSHASVVNDPCSDRASLSCARVRGLMVTYKPLQRRMSDLPHRSGDCPTTT
jgi:hypothetical protein